MSLFTRLPIYAPGVLPVIAETDIDYLSSYEVSAYEHWVFDTANADSLIGAVNKKLLIAQSTPPVYSANYISMTNYPVGKGLLTDLDDSATPSDTMFAVVRDTSTKGLQGIFGSLGTSAEGGGGVIFNLQDAARTAFAYHHGVSTSTSTPADVPAIAGQWRFVACSRAFAAGNNVLRILVGGGNGNELANTGTYLKAPTGRKLGLGSPYFPASGVSTFQVDYAEFGVFKRALTLADLKAVYARSKVRMAQRGIVI